MILSHKSFSGYIPFLREFRDYTPPDQTIALPIKSSLNHEIIASLLYYSSIISGYCSNLFTLNLEMTMENQKSWTAIGITFEAFKIIS